jgi:hypothetical protein
MRLGAPRPNYIPRQTADEIQARGQFQDRQVRVAFLI